MGAQGFFGNWAFWEHQLLGGGLFEPGGIVRYFPQRGGKTILLLGGFRPEWDICGGVFGPQKKGVYFRRKNFFSKKMGGCFLSIHISTRGKIFSKRLKRGGVLRKERGISPQRESCCKREEELWVERVCMHLLSHKGEGGVV